MKQSRQLENWEISLIKRMLANGDFNKQEILAYFSQPQRSVNQARISEIAANEERFQGIRTATQAELLEYLSEWKAIVFPSAPSGMIDKQDILEFPDRPELEDLGSHSYQILNEIIGEFK